MRIPFSCFLLCSLAAAEISAAPVIAQSTTRVSVNSAGAAGNSDGYSPSISEGGRYVAFFSGAANLVSGDTNQRQDVFVHDRLMGETTRVSVDSSGIQGSDDSRSPSISLDGRHVAFLSWANNLVPGDTNHFLDVFVHDRQTKLTSRVSVNSAGAQTQGGNRSKISPDGRYVVFDGTDPNLVLGKTTGNSDVFVHDRQTGQTSRVSVDSTGVEGNGHSFQPAVSFDGRYIAFRSEATNLVPGDSNLHSDVFVHDLLTGETTRASVDSTGLQGSGHSRIPSLSFDGRFIAFASAANNLVFGDTNGVQDIFIHDRQTSQTSRVSVDSAGTQGNNQSANPSISSDGRYISFASAANNLVFGDTNGYQDVFVHDRLGPSLTKTGLCPGSMTFTASGVTPGGNAAFIWGAPGSFTIPPGHPCAGTQLNLVPLLAPPPGYAAATANSAAIAAVTANVPAGACGVLILQAVDLSTCSATNTMSF